jgi:hypothetical protein
MLAVNNQGVDLLVSGESTRAVKAKRVLLLRRIFDF